MKLTAAEDVSLKTATERYLYGVNKLYAGAGSGIPRVSSIRARIKLRSEERPSRRTHFLSRLCSIVPSVVSTRTVAMLALKPVHFISEIILTLFLFTKSDFKTTVFPVVSLEHALVLKSIILLII